MSESTINVNAKNIIKQYMKSSQRKVDKIPKFLYHGSHSKNRDSILEKGLLPNEIYGEIYLCESPDNVKTFMNIHGVSSYDIFEINARNLPKKEFRLSDDHNRNFINCEVYSFFDKIPSNLVRLYNEETPTP